ncbi:ATP-binding protein [Streptomyces tropicalis]|uniref:Regulator n=1 Tax=Streptomyces tropicalis TaxID=3034234 RepID=A0ABT6A3H1_9ACTN|nr:regulator [Streptomyces tropicalis]MDF3299201.1 regulator [Streptomyces tropicalis]
MLSNLPESDAELVGRRAELEDLADALKRHRVVTLTGTGGVGKSRLALCAAHRVRDAGARGVAWADLWPLRDDRLLIATVADAADFSDHTATMPLDALCEWLADKDAVLVLDSCEHLLADCRPLVARLVMSCPSLTVLATSREPLGVPGEHVRPVEPLPVETDALELLARRAESAGAPLTAPADLVAATRLCRWLEGIPLALELVAGQLAERTVTAIERDLRSRLDVASGDGPGGPPRHRTMRTAIGWSHELCAPAERLLWARLSVFRDVVDAATVRAVCSGGPLPAADVDRAIAGLTAKSVLFRTGTGYRMLDTVREYGGMWLDAVGEAVPMADRHAEHFLALTRRAHGAWLGPHQAAWYRRVEETHADLCAALDHFLATRPHAALEMAGLLAFFWSCCGHLREVTVYVQAALTVADEPTPARTRALWGLGVARVLRGEHHAAGSLAETCRLDAQAQGDDEGILHAAYLEGLMHLLNGRPMAARWAVDTALDTAEGPGVASAGQAVCRLVRVFALTAEGLLEQARREAGDLHAACVALDEWWTRSYCDYQLALIALFEDRVEDAAGHAVSMLEGKRHIGDSFGLALGLDLLAAALAAQGAGEPAVAAYGAGETFWSAVGHPQRGTPELGPVRERYEATARSLLGDDGYEEALLHALCRDPETVLADLLDRAAGG